MKSCFRENKLRSGVATILVSLLAGMTLAPINSSYAAGGEKDAVVIKAAIDQTLVRPNVLVFPVVIREEVKSAEVAKADAKLPVNSSATKGKQIFVLNPFFFAETLEELD